MAGKMKIVLEPRQRGIAVARFTGRLDFTSAAEARGQFTQAIGAGHRKLIIDLSKVDFVDSAGLGSLIGGMRAARQAGGDLRIADPSEQARMLLSLTSLDQVLKIHPTVEEAVVGFA
jgi:anti-sigma B factor antagonist